MGRKIWKRGISHIEVVLSFAIFSGFVLFLLLFLNPIKTTSSEGSYINDLVREIEKNIETRVDYFSINLNNNENCFYIDYANLSKIVVKNETGARLKAYNDNKLHVKADSSGKFFYIYSNEDFNETLFSDSCSELDSSEYKNSLITSYNISSYKKLKMLVNECKADYEGLKKKFGISKEFYFYVGDNLGEMVVDEGNKLECGKIAGLGVKVSAKTFPLKMVYEDGDFKYVNLNVRIW